MCVCVCVSGVRPYRCDRCDKAFTQRCSLESHTRKVHGVELQFAYKQRRPKTYVCEECGHTASQPEHHYLHLRRLHPYSPALERSHDKRLFKFSPGESPLLPPTEWITNGINGPTYARVRHQPNWMGTSNRAGFFLKFGACSKPCNIYSFISPNHGSTTSKRKQRRIQKE